MCFCLNSKAILLLKYFAFLAIWEENILRMSSTKAEIPFKHEQFVRPVVMLFPAGKETND